MNDEVGALSYKEQAGEMQFYRPHSDEKTDLIDSEVRKLIKQAYDVVWELLSEKREELDKVAELLLEKEVISHEDMTELLGPRDGQDAAYDYATLAQLEERGELGASGDSDDAGGEGHSSSPGSGGDAATPSPLAAATALPSKDCQ